MKCRNCPYLKDNDCDKEIGDLEDIVCVGKYILSILLDIASIVDAEGSEGDEWKH